jgi:hypothetical protein
LYDQLTDFRFYLDENNPESLSYLIASAIYGGKSRQEVQNYITNGVVVNVPDPMDPTKTIQKQVNFDTDIARRANLGLVDPNKPPTKQDYVDLIKTLYDDKKAVAKAMSEQDKAYRESNLFSRAGLPQPSQQFTPEELGQIFPEQFKTIQQRLEQRLPMPAMPTVPKGLNVPGIVEGRAPVPSQLAQAGKERADITKTRQQVQDELNKIIQQKAAQAGFTPFMLEAARRLSIGR